MSPSPKANETQTESHEPVLACQTIPQLNTMNTQALDTECPWSIRNPPLSQDALIFPKLSHDILSVSSSSVQDFSKQDSQENDDEPVFSVISQPSTPGDVEHDSDLSIDSQGEQCHDNDKTDDNENLLDNPFSTDYLPGKVDLRLQAFQDFGRLSDLFPGAYYDFSKRGWMCRKCRSFAKSSSNPWVSSGVTLGHKPTEKCKKHFESKLHKNSLEAESYLKGISVYEMVKTQNLTLEEKTSAQNRKVLGSLFTVGLYMVKHCLANDTYTDTVKMVADAGAEHLKVFIRDAAKNATYLSQNTYIELLKTMNEYVETKILENAKSEYFTLFVDETPAIGNQSMTTIYIMFDDGKGINEHYLSTVNMNKVMGLTARHYYDVIVKVCDGKGLDLQKCIFSEMDGCSTNQGCIKGLKLYFPTLNPFHVSESCGSHKLARLPPKIIDELDLKPLTEADALVVNLVSFFRGSSLRTAIFENAQIIMELGVLKLQAPSHTRWLSHGPSFTRILERFIPLLETLNSIHCDKDDAKVRFLFV